MFFLNKTFRGLESVSVKCILTGKISVFYVGTIQKIYLSSDDFYFDKIRLLGFICLKYF
jgi:hypothetical protein